MGSVLLTEDLSKHHTAWLQNLQYIKNQSAHTCRAYKADTERFFAFIQNYLGTGQPLSTQCLADITLPQLQAYVADLARHNVAARSRARILSSLRQYYAWLDREGVAHNPYIKILRMPKTPRTLPRPIDTNNITHILDDTNLANQTHLGTFAWGGDWQGARDRALFGLLYGAGLRIAEALQLNANNWAQTADSIIVMGKRAKQRQVPLLPVVKTWMAEYQQACPYDFGRDAPLFFGARGERLHQTVAQRNLRLIRERLGLPSSVTPHALRHSFATHLLQAGVNLREIQELLGHSSLSSTQIYTDVTVQDLVEALEKFHPRQ